MYYRLLLYFLCLSFTISRFSMQHWALLENSIRNQVLGAECAPGSWGVVTFRPSADRARKCWCLQSCVSVIYSVNISVYTLKEKDIFIFTSLDVTKRVTDNTLGLWMILLSFSKFSYFPNKSTLFYNWRNKNVQCFKELAN